MALALVGVGYFLNSYYCGFTTDIKAYAGGSDFYYFGPKYCPTTWTFKGVNESRLEKMNDGDDIVVITRSESKELEEILTRNYLDFNVYIAGSELGKFVIYETECQKCQK